MKHRYDRAGDDFTCIHCKNLVSTNPRLSGVNNRNHCPYCLWSRHVDSKEAGDRRAACKGAMQPVGLTVKRVKNKYGSQQGELMLIHQCSECGKVSINRIAADDDNENILQVYRASFDMPPETAQGIADSGITLLGADDEDLVLTRLFGYNHSERGQA